VRCSAGMAQFGPAAFFLWRASHNKN
jgi:hypothetical protein